MKDDINSLTTVPPPQSPRSLPSLLDLPMSSYGPITAKQAAAREICSAALTILAARGRVDRLGGFPLPVRITRVDGLVLLYRPPLVGPDWRPIGDRHRKPHIEQMMQSLWGGHGLDIAEDVGQKVCNLEWSRGAPLPHIVRFDRGHWEDVVMAASEATGPKRQESIWEERASRVDALIADGRVFRKRSRRGIGLVALESVAASHRGDTVRLVEADAVDPKVIARVNRALKARPTERLLWWSDRHEALDGSSVADALVQGRATSVLGLAKRFARQAQAQAQASGAFVVDSE